jgi:hypothetical protein
MQLLTTNQVAAMHGVSPRAITHRALRLGMKPTARIGRTSMWTPAQAKRLAKDRRGR